MGICPIDWQSWIEVWSPAIESQKHSLPTQLDRNFPMYYRLCASCLASPRRPKLLCTLMERPNLMQGGTDVARELVQSLAGFLIARYPGVCHAM